MDEDQIMQQETQEEGTDGFLEGWEETGPGGEETGPEVDGEGQAESQPEGQEPAGDQDGGPETPTGDAPVGGDQPTGEHDGQPSEEAQPAQPPRTWTLNHWGQPVTISEADVPALAQKGLDYDRVRTAYEEARPVMELFQGFAKQAGVTVQDYVARLRTQVKEAQGMEPEAARRAVELEDRETRMNIQEETERQRQEAGRRAQAMQAQRQTRIQNDIQEFATVFPDAALDFKSIPQEVWEAVNGGMSLVAAYARYNSAQANASAQKAEEERRRQEAVRQQNDRNAAASTGSMKSAGSDHGPKDPFLEGWDE